jgi:hypothetical protein
MEPLIRSGQEVTVEPLGEAAIHPGDVVLCRVRGAHYLHLVKAVQGDRYLIGNNRGGVNGWITRRSIYGRWIRRSCSGQAERTRDHSRVGQPAD